jgi:hypothetical protein
MDTAVLSSGRTARNVQLTSYPNLVPRIRMNGAIRLRPLFVLMVWSGKNSPLRNSNIWPVSKETFAKNSVTQYVCLSVSALLTVNKIKTYDRIINTLLCPQNRDRTTKVKVNLDQAKSRPLPGFDPRTVQIISTALSRSIINSNNRENKYVIK